MNQNQLAFFIFLSHIMFMYLIGTFLLLHIIATHYHYIDSVEEVA